MKKGIKKFNIIAIVVVCINIILMIYAGVSVKKEDTTLFTKEMYSFDTGWVMTDKNGSTSKTVTFPFVSGGNLPEKTKNPDVQKKNTDIEKDKSDPVSQGAVREKPATGEGMAPGENVPRMADDTIILQNTIPKKYAGLTLTFSSLNGHFRVWIDGENVYEEDMEDEEFVGKGNETHFVNIPSELNEGKIQIEFMKGSHIRIENIQVAKRDTAVLSLISRNLFNIACSLVLLVCAVILFLLTAIRRYSRQSTDGMFYLGIFCLDASVYYALETQIVNVFVPNETIIHLLMYSCLMLLPYFLLIYYERRLLEKVHVRFVVLLWLSTANIAIQLILQIMKVQNFQTMSFVSEVLLFLVLLVVYKTLFDVRQLKFRRRGIIEGTAVTIFIAALVVDFVRFQILHAGMQGQFARYATTVFAAVLMLLHIMHVSEGYLESVAEKERLLKREVEYMQQQNEQLLAAKEEAEEAKKQAMAANETKGRFLANMSHEIRTPINAVLGMNEMVLRETSQPQVKEYAMDIQTAGQNLLSLVNDILDFSKIDSGKMEIVPVAYDLSSMIHDIVNMIHMKAQAKHLELQVQVDPTLPSGLYGDDVRLRQVLVNILTNAVKYTEEGSVLFRVQRRCQSEDTVELYFEVKDTGIGIRQEDISKLFVEFERIEEKRNRSIEGTGLGMNITMQLLQLMGSKLEVKSVYGEGSDFSFTIEQKVMQAEPIGDLEERIRRQSQEFSYEAAFVAPQARILVVDDNVINCKVFCNLLKETKIQVDMAYSGVTALEMAQKKEYHIIFLDHMMPEMDGIETLRRMKEEQNKCSESKVVALTANAISGAREMYLNAGFDAFLAKPVQPERLEKMVKEMLPPELVLQAAKRYEEEEAAQENTTEELQLPAVDGIDWDYGRLHLPDQELLLDTVKDFYVTLQKQADTLEGYFEQKDQENYRILVHSMKSSAALIGAVPLAGMAKTLEDAAREGDWETIEAMHVVFYKQWNSYKERLHNLCDAPDTEKHTVEDISVIKAYLEMLRIAMDELDIDKADETMQNLKMYRYTDTMEKYLSDLELAVTNLDADAACEQIDLCMQELGK